MTKFRILTISVFVFCFCGASAVSAEAQRRPVPPKPKVITTSTLPGANNVKTDPTAAKTGPEKVSIQIKNVSKFIYVLGGVARGIEDIDKDRKANRDARAENEQNKRKVIQTIRNLRAGLAALEVEFRTQPALKRYLRHIQGITDLSSQAEDLAFAGRFTDSGKPLLLVVEKLADTLAAM